MASYLTRFFTAGIEQSDGILLPSVEIYGCHATSHPDDNGVYEAEDSTLRAFVNESPRAAATPRARSQVDLVLPPATAFTMPGMWQPASEPAALIFAISS
jgi:hypothetical protein